MPFESSISCLLWHAERSDVKADGQKEKRKRKIDEVRERGWGLNWVLAEEVSAELCNLWWWDQ